jgi:cytochrome c biogenesis protein CcmG, thiol:disulfide interchange protein DsbE
LSAAVVTSTKRPVAVKRAIVVSIASLVAFAVVIGLLLTRGGTATTGASGRAPGFSLADVNDPATMVTLPEGEPTVLYFFASWCIPCRKELPIVQQIHTERDDVRVIGVNHQDHRDDAREFMAKYGATFPAAHDPGASVALDYGLRGLPVTVFIDSSGRIASTVHGEVDRDELDERIDDLLEKDAAA